MGLYQGAGGAVFELAFRLAPGPLPAAPPPKVVLTPVD